MKLDQDTLKKHHFWILLGLVPVFVLAAVLAVSGSVGGAIEDRSKKVDAAQKEVDGKQAVKSDPLIKVLDTQQKQLEEKRTDLWKENWERQIGVSTTVDKAGKVTAAVQDPTRNLLRWPKSPLLDRFNYTPAYAADKAQLKFGEKIPSPNGDEYNQFKVREVYLAEFSNARPGFAGTGMADRVAPTEFLGGWQSVLRHVSFPPVGTTGPNGWGDALPTSERLWLALEDVWVQRAVLGQIKAVNDQIGTFTRVALPNANGQPADAPLHRLFASRTWQVELKVVTDEKDGRPVLTGRLKNLTDRLQPLGLGSRLTLNVWLTPDPAAAPFAFHVGGEFLRGGEEKEVLRTADHAIPAGTAVTEIARVEQAFDARTVPVRRIDALALGFKDSRYALAPLLPPEFELYKKEAEKEKAAADGGGSGGAGGGTGQGGPPPGSGTSAGGPPPGAGGGVSLGSRSIPGGGGGPGAPGAAGGGGAGGGSADAVLDGNKKRYVVVTPQVRRMPVAVTVVVDQAYIQDVLVAYANSPLRFQVSQVTWQRFRGTLAGAEGGAGGSSGPDGGVSSSGSGVVGGGFGAGLEGGGLSRPPGPNAPGGRLPGSAGGPPPGAGGSAPGAFGPPPGAAGPPGFGPGGTLTTVSEGQLTAGLVELTVYGIVSLYEKYQPAADPAAPAP